MTREEIEASITYIKTLHSWCDDGIFRVLSNDERYDFLNGGRRLNDAGLVLLAYLVHKLYLNLLQKITNNTGILPSSYPNFLAPNTYAHFSTELAIDKLLVIQKDMNVNAFSVKHTINFLRSRISKMQTKYFYVTHSTIRYLISAPSILIIIKVKRASIRNHASFVKLSNENRASILDKVRNKFDYTDFNHTQTYVDDLLKGKTQDLDVLIKDNIKHFL